VTGIAQDADFMGKSEAECNFRLPDAKNFPLNSSKALLARLLNAATEVNQIGGYGTLDQTWTPDTGNERRSVSRALLRIAIPSFRTQQTKLRNQFRSEPNVTRDEVRDLFDDFLPAPISKAERFTESERLQMERNKAIRAALRAGQPARK
jgi:hypothetical protein